MKNARRRSTALGYALLAPSLFGFLAFLVAPVELGALVAGAAGVAIFFLRARLTRLHDAAFDFAEMGEAMQDRLVIAVRCDPGEDANCLIALLAEAGALTSRIESSRIVTP